jgi:DNA-binding response OmpR family regulator
MPDSRFQQPTAASIPIISFKAPRPLILIVLDVIMPLMSGVKKAKLLKQREKSSHLPIILMSSKAEEELKGLAQEAMADDYLFKPFTADQLTVKVLNILP